MLICCGMDWSEDNTIIIQAGSQIQQQRRPSSVMFSDVVLFHGGGTNGSGGETTKNVCSSEKMTQTGDDNLWPGSVQPQQQVRSLAIIVSTSVIFKPLDVITTRSWFLFQQVLRAIILNKYHASHMHFYKILLNKLHAFIIKTLLVNKALC